MPAFEWYGEVEFLAQMDPNTQMAEYSEGARIAHYNSVDMVLRLGQYLDATEYQDALAEATAWVAGLAVTGLAAQGRAAGPIRFAVTSQIVRSQQWAVGTKEAAELLGLTPTRLRQLDNGLPDPVTAPAGGKVWRRDEVETFARERQPGRPGRPRKAAPEADGS